MRARDDKSIRWIVAALMLVLLGVAGALRADDKEKNKDKKKDNPPPATQPKAKSTPPPASRESGDRQGGSGKHKAPEATPKPSTSQRDNNSGSGKNKAPEADTRPPSSQRESGSGSGKNKDQNQKPDADSRPASQPRSSSDRDSEAARKAKGNSDSKPAASDPAAADRAKDGAGKGKHPQADSSSDPQTKPSSSGRPSDTRSERPAKTAPGPDSKAGNRPSDASADSKRQRDRKPGAVLHGANNTEAHVGDDGRIAVVRRPGVTIQRSSIGARRVVVERPDKTVIVVRDAGRGYVQRPITLRNEAFVHRTYYSDNRSFVKVYRPYRYHGVILNAYVPVRYYSPAFYGWAYSPWASPVSYRWGWSHRGWYGYYGGYFTPYPTYLGPALWLTDFLVASTLEDAYRDGMAAGYARYDDERVDTDGPGLTPEVKRLIEAEVQRQLDLEREEAQGAAWNGGDGLPPMLSGDGPRVFVVGRALDVINLSDRGRECLISEGDVLQASRGLASGRDSAEVVVLASKGRECRVGSTVAVPLEELLEMQNQMRERLGLGLDALREKQGRDGLPPLPSSLRATTMPASFAGSLPPADPQVASELERESREASRTEHDALGDGDRPGDSDDDAPPTITRGQTIDDVVDILGPPRRIVDLGAKKIYIYDDMKITFLSGEVSDVE